MLKRKINKLVQLRYKYISPRTNLIKSFRNDLDKNTKRKKKEGTSILNLNLFLKIFSKKIYSTLQPNLFSKNINLYN